MLLKNALEFGYVLRQDIGADKRGAGPQITTLLSLDDVKGNNPADIRRAINQPKKCGFIRLDKHLAPHRRAYLMSCGCYGFRAIAAIFR